MNLPIAEVDPQADDVRELIGRHMGFTAGASPAEFAFALDHDKLVDGDYKASDWNTFMTIDVTAAGVGTSDVD